MNLAGVRRKASGNPPDAFLFSTLSVCQAFLRGCASASHTELNLITRALELVSAIGLLALAGCGNGITAPKCALCDELRVLTDHAEYRQGSWVAFTITNRTPDVLRYDWCSVEHVARTSSEEPFDVRYVPSRRCGFGAGIDQVREHMVALASGEARRDSVFLSGAAFQGQYRIHVWLVDESGVPDADNPVVSNTVDVFPTANHSVVEQR